MKKNTLTKKIFIGLFLGIVFGLVLNVMPKSYLKETIIIGGLLKLVGGIFISGIKMLVVPLVFVSLIVGASAIGDPNKLGRVGSKTIIFYLVTTSVAIFIALSLASFTDPGIGLDLSNIITKEPTIGQSTSVVETIINMIPRNPISALAAGKMLQVIVFALLTGISIALLGEKGKPAYKFFESLNEVMMKMVMIIMSIAPYGVFALISKTFATVGFDAIVPLLKYFFTVLIALLLHALITYMGMLKIVGKLDPIQFFKNFVPAMGVAFSTASSSGTLPVTLKTAQERCGASKSISSFTLPLGATINMDGTAIMQGVAVIFIAQVYSVPLSLTALLTVVLTATLASVGTAGVPGVGLITLSMVLQSVGLPIEGIALIIGIDRLLDMTRTAINITGDTVCTLLISKMEGEFDEEIYYASNETVATEEISESDVAV